MKAILFILSPLTALLVALFYATVVGIRVWRTKGAISVFGVALTLLGLVIGRILEAAVPKSKSLNAWIDYQLGTRLERMEDVFAAENALLILAIAGIAFFWVTLAKKEIGEKQPIVFPNHYFLLAGEFVCAICVTAKGKIAAYGMLVLIRFGILA